MKRPRHSSYPMSLEESEELARELDEFGYRETSDPDEADRRRCYIARRLRKKVEMLFAHLKRILKLDRLRL